MKKKNKKNKENKVEDKRNESCAQIECEVESTGRRGGWGRDDL